MEQIDKVLIEQFGGRFYGKEKTEVNVMMMTNSRGYNLTLVFLTKTKKTVSNIYFSLVLLLRVTLTRVM